MNPKATDRIWLSPPHLEKREWDYVRRAMESNWVAPAGPDLDLFEKELASFCGSNHAVAVNSGTAAIHLALRLLGVGRGDTVVCQSLTFVASVNPVRYLGAEPVFVDSEPLTWNMCPESLEQALAVTRPRPKAIIAVDLYGMPAQMKRICQIAAAYDVPVIEDAAEAMGSSLDSTSCGSLAPLGILSFNGNKIITTSAGGALLVREPELAERARFLSTQARDPAPHYEHSELGYNYRLSNILAALGRAQLEQLPDRIRRRRDCFRRYFEQLDGAWLPAELADGSVAGNHHQTKQESHRKASGSPYTGKISSGSGCFFLKEPEGYRSNRWLTTLVALPEHTGGIQVVMIRKALESNNIEARPLWKPMHMQPFYRDAPYISSRGDIAGWLYRHGLCLPSGSGMSIEEQDRVISVIRKTLSGK